MFLTGQVKEQVSSSDDLCVSRMTVLLQHAIYKATVIPYCAPSRR
jgi:hypothetical protein